jgi:energy-coupling factor transporter transmembrane protein EcfT
MMFFLYSLIFYVVLVYVLEKKIPSRQEREAIIGICFLIWLVIFVVTHQEKPTPCYPDIEDCPSGPYIDGF